MGPLSVIHQQLSTNFACTQNLLLFATLHYKIGPNVLDHNTWI